MLFVTIVSVLALVVALGAAVALIDLALRFRILNRSSSAQLQKIIAVDKSLKLSERAAIVAEVAALEGVVGKLGQSMRKQFGTIHAKVAALEALRAEEEASKESGTDGERPSREELRVRYLRPPLPPTQE